MSSCQNAWPQGLELFFSCPRANGFLHVGAVSLAPWPSALRLLESTWDRRLPPGAVAFSAALGACGRADAWRAAGSVLRSGSGEGQEGGEAAFP